MKQHQLAVAAAVLLGLSVSGASTASPPLKACKLLKRSEAAAIVKVKVEPPFDGGSICTFNGYPTGPTAQVTVFVSNGVPRTLTVDRSLHHQFRRVPHLGNEALEEMWTIFVRKGGAWVMISVVRSDDWTKYRAALEHAARIAISRLGAASSKKATGGAAAIGRAPGATSGRVPAVRGVNSRWRGSERRFGGSVGHYPGVVYQSDVIVIGGGADAIRAESADGLTWTLAGNAPGVRKLRVGSIMLATAFASGKVLALRRAGPNVRVTLGPAALTQIIRDGTFASKQPIRLSRPLFYSAALPATVPKAARKTQSAAQATGRGPSASFGTTPICCSSAVGVHLSYDNGEGRLAATLQLYLEQPTVTFSIRIGGGKLLEAQLELHGAGGFSYSFFGATKNIAGNVRSGPLFVPGSITIPLVGPLSLQLEQSFDVSMQLAGAGWMDSSGDYRFSGTLGFGTNGPIAYSDPVSLSVRKPLLQHTASQGIGSDSFSAGWGLKATVGIGVGGLSAGAWFQIRPALAVTMASDPGGLEQGCVRGSIDVSEAYGVGYTIPEFARKIVNAILSALSAEPIPKSAGPHWGPKTIWHPADGQACPSHP